MRISFAIVMGSICLFTEGCIWSKRTLEVVHSCPTNKEETTRAARIKGCDVIAFRQNCTKSFKFKYHCLYSYIEKSLVEVCAIETIIHGVCIVYDERLSNIQPIYNVKCRDISSPCPEKYLSTEGHLYATCPALKNVTFFDTKDPKTPEPPKNESQIVMILVVSLTIVFISSMILLAMIWKKLCWKKSEDNTLQGSAEEMQPLNERKTKRNKSKHHADNGKEQLLGPYEVWKTTLADMISQLSQEELSVLFCLLCSDSCFPDFNSNEWLDILNEIRRLAYDAKICLKSTEATEILTKLISKTSLIEGHHISNDAADETIYRVHANITGRGNRCNILFYLPSFNTAWRYLRCRFYHRKPSEKCVIAATKQSERLLVLRLQMDILTHTMLEDTDISEIIFAILNVSKEILNTNMDDRKLFVRDLESDENRLPFKDLELSEQAVAWNWRHKRYNIVRSCIGQYPHLDIFIIRNIAYRIQSRFHSYPSQIRCLLYCLLLVDNYTFNINDKSHGSTLSKLQERYFRDLSLNEDLIISNAPGEIVNKQGSNLIFKSEEIRHDVMYAFVTECVTGDSDLEFFLRTASCQVLSEYCRSWTYKKAEGERCLYVPDIPEEMYSLFISRFNLDVIKHSTVSDEEFRLHIRKQLQIPIEILNWDKEARERYLKYSKKGTHAIHHARGMIVGCAGAGKTTLLKRLLRCEETEIEIVKSTIGLEVHEEMFEICEDEQTLKARQPSGEEEAFETNAKTISFFDFAGQCVYYACHQIYLTRRAFYIVAVDASKNLNMVVGEHVCDQTGTVFSGWTYGEYFIFWLKSIHTYCTIEDIEDKAPDVLIVATHWDGNTYQDNKEVFLESLQRQIPENSNLLQYIRSSNCYFTLFPCHPLTDLEKRIISIASNKRWTEKIPADWAFMETEISEKVLGRKIARVSEIKSKLPDSNTCNDLLRFYHDAGKILYFNEKFLNNFIILDVQWFVDAFKNIITDKLHVTGLVASRKDWDEYYTTGHLQDRLLTAIWGHKNKDHFDTDNKKTGSLLYHKDYILQYMQRLGLVAMGKESHYVPSMNRKEFDNSVRKLIQENESKTSVLIYLFDFLPFFLFFRLVVACMQLEGWKVVRSEGQPCLYQNVALFLAGEYHIVIGVTASSLQLQIFHLVQGCSLEIEKTRQIQTKIEDKLNDLTFSFQRKMQFSRGFSCENLENQVIPIEVEKKFIGEEDIGTKEWVLCPLHQLIDRHTINPKQLGKYWILNND